jgi:hypothetical protein
MRSRSLIWAAALATAAACHMPSLPELSGFEPGAWRTGVAVSVGESTTQGDLDVSADRISFDAGKLIGEHGEFGLRLSSADLDETGAETGSIGGYGRYWFRETFWLRPWAELSAGFAGLDFGAGDESGWEWGAGAGATWWLFDSVGVEVYLRELYGNYETDEVRSTDFGVGLAVLW